MSPEVLLLSLAGLVAIVAASELFTNAIEWTGHLLGLGTGATGSLLAALGTALPETVVPIVALATRARAASSVAMGAVLGSSMMLLSLAIAITGFALFARKGARHLANDTAQTTRDLSFFTAAFAGSLVMMTLPVAVHRLWGLVLLAVYAVYVALTLRASSGGTEMPEPLHLTFHAVRKPPGALVALQLFLSVALLVGGSDIFVSQIGTIAASIRLDPLVLAILIIPVATELPESLNSVFWIRSSDDGLAIGNIVGSATFQACVLGAIAMEFTAWNPGMWGVIGAVATLICAAFLFGANLRGKPHGGLLLLSGIPWAAYVASALAVGLR